MSRFGFVLECDSGQWVITLPGADSDHQIVLVDCVGSPKIPNVATCRAVPRYYELINEIEVQQDEDPKSRPNHQGEVAAHQGTEDEPTKTDSSQVKSAPSAIQLAPIVPSMNQEVPDFNVVPPRGAAEAKREGDKNQNNDTKTTLKECGRKDCLTRPRIDCPRMGGNRRDMTSCVVVSTVGTRQEGVTRRPSAPVKSANVTRVKT